MPNLTLGKSNYCMQLLFFAALRIFEMALQESSGIEACASLHIGDDYVRFA